MADASYERLKAVFVEAQELTGPARESFLARACGDDSGLRDRVERLLAVNDAGGGVLAGSIEPEGASDGRRFPERIGEYAVRGVLGVGGMSVVYRAEQASPRRAVAVKVLRPGAVTRAALGRFRHEAELLGRLKHPGIAQIYESGTWSTEHGEQPFLVMELVEGTPLTDCATQGDLDVRARLRLAIQICRAVHYAHEKSVIHRDLKPGNILVTAEGQPKVIDFGIAKLTESDSRTTTLLTRDGQLLGTIPYMSPEQVSGDAATIDLRTDVYALGVITYELVSGVLPHDLSRASVTEAARIICEEDPPRLSSIDRALRGDLETIVAKALEKDRARRYPSASALADDIERHLRDEPISARPASTAYQLRKLARRHRGLFAGLAVAMAVLAAATVVSSILAVEASRQRDRARTEVERLQVSDEIRRSMQFAADPRAYMDYLETAAAQVASTYASRPAAEGTARRLLAGYFWRAGRFGDWRSQLDAAVALQARLGPEHPVVLDALLDTADGLTTLGKYSETEALLGGVCERCERTFGRARPETVRCLSARLISLYHLRRWQEAFPLARDAAERARAELPADDSHRSNVTRTIAYLEVQLGNPSEGIALLRENVAAAIAKYGDEHLRTHALRLSLATALREVGRYDEAIEIGQRALRESRRQKGESSPDTARIECELAITLSRAGRHAEAATWLEHCIEVFADTQGQEEPETLQSRLSLAETLLDAGELARAEPIAAAILASCELALALDPILTADARHLLGRIRHAQGRPAEAEPLFAAAIEAARAWDAVHPQTIRLRCDLARCLAELDRLEEAEASLLACHALAASQLGARSRLTDCVARALVDLYVACGRTENAEAWRRRLQ